MSWNLSVLQKQHAVDSFSLFSLLLFYKVQAITFKKNIQDLTTTSFCISSCFFILITMLLCSVHTKSYNVFTLELKVRGEWHSGSSHYNYIREVSRSNPTSHSAELRDPTSLQGCRCPLGQSCTNAVINISLVKLSPWEWSKIGCGTVKYNKKKHCV